MKRRYPTIDEAWLDAFRLFVQYGDVMTPYYCTPVLKRTTVLIVRPQPNPWSWKPWWWTRATNDLPRATSCGGWHLTKKCVDFLLAPSEA